MVATIVLATGAYPLFVCIGTKHKVYGSLFGLLFCITWYVIHFIVIAIPALLKERSHERTFSESIDGSHAPIILITYESFFKTFTSSRMPTSYGRFAKGVHSFYDLFCLK